MTNESMIKQSTAIRDEAINELHTLLLEGKNSLLNLIWTAEGALDLRKYSLARESLQKAADLLYFVRPLWNGLGYGYKVRELQARITYDAIAIKEQTRGAKIKSQMDSIIDLMSS